MGFPLAEENIPRNRQMSLKERVLAGVRSVGNGLLTVGQRGHALRPDARCDIFMQNVEHLLQRMDYNAGARC